MTQKEKHALIAERLEGWKWVQLANGRWITCKSTYTLQIVELYPETPVRDTHPASAGYDNAPNYSSDLNLCARVERKIAEMGRASDYIARLGMQLVTKFRDGEIRQGFANAREDLCWWFLSAPATARVDAMVALIQQMNTEVERG